MHIKRCSVKSGRGLIGLGLAALSLALAGPARAETVYPGQVNAARLFVGGGETVIAYALGANVEIARKLGSDQAIGFPGPVEIDGLSRDAVLGRDVDGRWLALWYDGELHRFHRDSKQARFGPAGLAVDRAGLPVVAYALWFPSRKTFLRLARVDARGRWTTRPVTKGGFPSTPGYAAAAPVVRADGTIRVVETYVPGAIDWGLDGWGKVLFSTALGVPVGGVRAAAVGTTLYAAWTTAFPTLGPPAVVLATRADRVRTGVALENAVLADLAVTETGVELAANRCVPAAAFGEAGNGVCGGIVNGVGVDGLVAGYAAAGTERQLLLQTTAGLEWFTAPSGLAYSVTLNADLTGRVEGATSGTVSLYRERPGERAVVSVAPVGPDGTFIASDPTASPVVAAHRAVYVDPATGIPYAALAGP